MNKMQQPQENTSLGLETVTESKFSPTDQSLQKGQWIFTQIFNFLAHIFDYVGSFFNTYKQSLISLALILAAFVALRVVLAVIDALNDIPLLASTFKLVGIGYSIWFVKRYLLQTETRQEFSNNLQNFLGKHTWLVSKDVWLNACTSK